MSQHLEFSPSWYVRHRHFQSIYHKVARRNPVLPECDEWTIPLSDGNFLRGDYWEGDSRKRLAILYHGLGGHRDAEYLVGAGLALRKNGYHVLRMDLRGAEKNPSLSSILYSSDSIEDFTLATEAAQERGFNSIYVVGFSLTGNMVLRWLAQKERRTDGVMVVSPPVQLSTSVDLLNQPSNRIYQWYFLRKLRAIVRQKAFFYPESFGKYQGLERYQTIRDFDDNVTAPLNGFGGAEEYYETCSSYRDLQSIRNRVAIVHSLDDPFIDSKHLKSLSKNCPENIDLFMYPRGGHLGFYEGCRRGYAVDRWVVEYFDGLK